jgi:cysteine-rich PDZ-binding protein
MVCDKCEEKLSKLIVPDKWTDGARNTTGGKDGGRAVGNDRLDKKRRANRCALPTIP